jgi:hypothetical protein
LFGLGLGLCGAAEEEHGSKEEQYLFHGVYSGKWKNICKCMAKSDARIKIWRV